uniref:Uncharacterized protein n=1 Tax=Sphaerodactylus townsendi TaxID=933632 RepID=A0ACB8G652_9SAUR
MRSGLQRTDKETALTAVPTQKEELGSAPLPRRQLNATQRGAFERPLKPLHGRIYQFSTIHALYRGISAALDLQLQQMPRSQGLQKLRSQPIKGMPQREAHTLPTSG